MAKRKSRKGGQSRGQKATRAGTAAAVVGPRVGIMTVIRRAWRTSLPKDSVLETLTCGTPPSMVRMLMLDPEDGLITDLRDWLRANPLQVADGQFPTTRDALNATLTDFCDDYNAKHAQAPVQLVSAADDCSAPNHISTGAGGCRPVGANEEGHTVALARSQDSQKYQDFSSFYSQYTNLRAQVGYVVSVTLHAAP